MSNLEVQPAAASAPQSSGLSQMQRIGNMFAAPSKTFDDIRDHSAAWWLPFLLFVVIGTGLWATINAKVGWTQVVENSLRLAPKQAEKLDQLPPEARASQMKIAPLVQEGIWGLAPVWLLVMNLIGAAVLLGTINFGFGGKASFPKVLAVSWYAGLPGLIKLLLGIAGLVAGMAPESFLPQNPAGTNPGFYFTPPDVSMAVWSILCGLDVITIWTLVLFSIGLAKVAKVKPSAGFIAVFGWWVVSMIIGIAMSAISG